ncbi:hypothetical protein B0H11DRAFT_2232106 [Mycena galericulata]|nr:hypothetical protein B0H11DRAFT_2232106 [Mycena galericulata]
MSIENMRLRHVFSGTEDERNFYTISARAEFRGIEIIRIISDFHCHPFDISAASHTAVILRYNPDLHKFQYTYYDNDFILIADSNIAINDHISHHVALRAHWSAGSFEVKMEWHILDVGAALQAEVTGILASRTISVGQTH